MFKSKKRGFEGKQPRVKEDAIIKFNIAGSGIPSSATVLNAQMKMYYYGTGGSVWVDRWLQAHQILVNWAEAQATSVNRLTGTAWNVAYVGLNDIDAKSSYESTLLFYLVGGQQVYGWKSWDLTSLTQKWVSGTATNYGVVLWATNETTDGKDLRFYSSEAVAPNDVNRPKLEIIYSQHAKTVYFLKDHLGSVRATVQDTVGAPVRGYDDYDPWGYILAGRSLASSILPTTTKNRFTGKERDDEFGVNWDYFGTRYYDAQIGRWLVRDPLAEKYPSYSPFVYTNNNPIRYFDPNGAYTVSSQVLFGSVYASARRTTYDEATWTELSGFVPFIGPIIPLSIKYGLGDPSYPLSKDDFGMLAAELAIGRAGGKIATVADISGWESLLLGGVFDAGKAALGGASLLDAAQNIAIGLDEITFEIASSINVGGAKFGDLGGFGNNTFTLGRELTKGKSAGEAKDFLEKNLSKISEKLKSIAATNKWNLSKRRDRDALRKYLRENRAELEEELGFEFIE